MNSGEVEARVIRAVEALQAGHGSGEDDLIEFKRGWFDPKDYKPVRQLAGSLNRAGGEPVILVIGVDDKTGKVMGAGQKEMGQWWPQVQKYFDQTLPELVKDLNIYIGDASVHALVVGSDRAPYVFKTGTSPFDREVPIREGTNTRSAHRDQLLRMLLQQQRVPEVDVIRGGCALVHHYSYGDPADPEEIVRYEGYLRLFFTPHGPTVIPRHKFSGSISGPEASYPLSLRYPEGRQSGKSAPLGRAVETEDGFYIAEPSGVTIRYVSNALPPSHASASNKSLNLELQLPVAGSLRNVAVICTLDPAMDPELHVDGHTEVLSAWDVAR